MRESASLELLGATAYAYCVPLDAARARGTGAVIGDFSRAIYDPAGTDITGITTVTLTEYGATGAYRFSVTLPALLVGNYTMAVTDSYGTTTSCVLQGYTRRCRLDDSSAQLEFWIHNAAGAPVPNVVIGDLTVRIYNPSMADRFAFVGAVLTEFDAIGDPGHYMLEFDTSSAAGDWFVDLIHPVHCPWGQQGSWTYNPPANRPTWPAGDTSGVTAIDADADGELIVSWDAATQDQGYAIYYAVEARLTAGPGAWVEMGRTTGLTLRIGGLAHVSYDIHIRAVACEAGQAGTTSTDTATATPTGSTVPVAPVLVSATDDGTGTTATLQFTTANPASYVWARYRRNDLDTWTYFATPRVGSGNLDVTGLGLYRYEFQGVSSVSTDMTELVSLPSSSSKFAQVTNGVVGDYAELRQAIYDWASTVLGITCIWKRANAPLPLLPFATLLIRPVARIARDHHAISAVDESTDILKGDRHFVAEIQIMGKLSPGGDNQAVSLANRLATSLQKRTILDALRAHGLFYQSSEPPRDISAIGANEWESRVVFEAEFGVASIETDPGVGSIGTFERPAGTYVP